MLHTQGMENQTQQNQILTKANEAIQNQTSTVNTETVKGVVLSTKDVEEYRAYKRRKMVEEIMQGMAKSASSLLDGDEVQRVCDRAMRIKQAAIQLPSSKLLQTKRCLYGVEQVKRAGKIQTVREFLSAKNAKARRTEAKKKVRLDCVIGGETSVSVKNYEARYALQNGARELTVIITPSLIEGGKYTEIRKELRRLVWAAKRATFKVWASNEYPIATLGRLARLSSEVGAHYFCVPYFDGCERIRFDLVNGCKLQVSGVETLVDYKKMLSVGAGRIISDRAWEIYEEWMEEADKIEFAKPALLLREKETTEDELKQDENAPTIEPMRKQPLPVSKVVQSGAIVDENKIAKE